LIKILIVDDNEPWRRFLCAVLDTEKSFEVVQTASDGVQGAHYAAKLQPDVVLLDISLPEVSGIQLGQCIHELTTDTKIVFVSAYRDLDMVRVALRLGGSAYVLKTDAALDLVPALHAVVRGDVFVSRGLPHCRLADLYVDPSMKLIRFPVCSR
jgi:YesN/AraC family two-component response regulator